MYWVNWLALRKKWHRICRVRIRCCRTPPPPPRPLPRPHAPPVCPLLLPQLRLVSSKYWPHGLTITTEPPDEPPLSPSAPSLNLAVSVDGSAWDDLPPSPAGDPAAPPGKPHKRPAKSPKAHQAPPPGHWGVLNAPCLPSPKSPSAAGKLVPPCSKKHLVGLQGYAPPLLSPGCDAASPVPSPKAHRSPLRSPKHRGPAGAAPLPDRPPSPGGLHCGPGLGESVGHGKPEPAGRAPGHLESLHDRPVSPKSRRHPSRAEGHAGDRAHELSPVVGHKGAHAHAHSSAPPTPHNRAGGSPGRDCGSPRDSSVSPRHRRAHHGPHATHPADGRGAAAAAGPDPLPDSPRRRRRKDKGAAPHARNDPHRTSPARDDSPRTSPAREGSPRTSPAREGSPRTSPARDDSPRAARGPDSPHRRAKRTPSKVTKPPPLVEPLEGPAHAKSPRARSPSPAGHGAPAEDAARAASPTCPPTHKSSAGSPAHLESLGHSLSTGIGRRSSSRVLSPKGALAAAPLESVLHPHADVASPGKIRRSPCDRGRQRSATPTGVTDGAIHLTTPGDALCRRSPRARAPLADLPDAAAEPATDHSLPPGHHLRPPDPQSRPAPHGSGTHIPRLDPLAAPPGGDSLHPSAQCLQPSPRRSSALHLPLDPLACAQALLPSDAECPFLGGSLLHCGSVKGLRGAAGRVDLTALANPLGASLSNDSLDTQLSAAAATPTSSSGKALKALTPADLAGPGGICGGDREAGAAHGALTKSPSLRGSAEGRLHVAQGHLTHSSPHGGPRLNGLQSLSARDVPA